MLAYMGLMQGCAWFPLTQIGGQFRVLRYILIRSGAIYMMQDLFLLYTLYMNPFVSLSLTYVGKHKMAITFSLVYCTLHLKT